MRMHKTWFSSSVWDGSCPTMHAGIQSALASPVEGVRRAAIPTPGEAGFASQSDSLDKAKVAPRSCSCDNAHLL